MTQDAIIFTMTAAPRPGGEQYFRNHIDHIVANGAKAAVFSIVSISDGSATFRGEVSHDPRTMTSEALEEYLEDVLAAREGIQLNLSVNENLSMPGPETRDENPPGTDGGYFLG